MSSAARRDLSGIPTSRAGSIWLLKYPGLAAGAFETPAPPSSSEGLPTPFYSHNDIGLNYVEYGEMQVLLSTGYRYVHRSRQLSIYWGAIPHRIERLGAPVTRMYWLSLPLGIYLRWSLPAAITEALIRGRVFIEDDEEGCPDLLRMRCWREDLEAGPPEAEPIVLLEVEARLRGDNAPGRPVPFYLLRHGKVVILSL